MKLFDALYSLAFILRDFSRGTASTAGSTTTLVDTVNRFESEDFFDNGTLFIKSGALADKALAISSWNGQNKTFTFATQGSPPGVGAIYAAMPKDYPKELMVECINQALVSIGELPQVDVTLTTVANREEETLPADVYNVKIVEIAHSLVTPYLYAEHYNWIERAGKLIFDTDYAPGRDGYKIRLSYNAPHAAVDDDADTIEDTIHPELLQWAAAVHAFRWRLKRNPDEVAVVLNEALLNYEKARRNPDAQPKKFKRSAHLSRWY